MENYFRTKKISCSTLTETNSNRITFGKTSNWQTYICKRKRGPWFWSSRVLNTRKAGHFLVHQPVAAQKTESATQQEARAGAQSTVFQCGGTPNITGWDCDWCVAVPTIPSIYTCKQYLKNNRSFPQNEFSLIPCPHLPIYKPNFPILLAIL